MCLLVLVASVSATPTLLVKKLALKKLLLGKLHGGVGLAAPVAYGAEPVPYGPVAPVAPIGYAQPVAYAQPIAYAQPAPVYAPAPAPQVVEARSAPAPGKTNYSQTI